MRIAEHQFAEHVSPFRRVLYLCHRNADPDAIGSGYALSSAFGGAVGVAEDMSRTGSSLARALDIHPIIDPRLEEYELVVLVDTSVGMQAARMLPERYALVDHHMDTGLLSDALFYIQRPAKSTSEIVWRILKECGRRPDRRAALGLLAGIISDTGRFKRATSEAFMAAADLLSEGGFSYEEVQDAISVPASVSQRIAVLKAASRAVILRQGDWIIASTVVNSFEGSAAMALIELGADVAFVAGRHGQGDLVRVSARSSRESARLGLNLAEILGVVGRAFGGDGGGHISAAALEASGEPSAILEACRNLTVQRLP